VAALWVDDEQTTAEFTAKHGLTFPLGHSADACPVAGLVRYLREHAAASS
jgi:hypothetical protein